MPLSRPSPPCNVHRPFHCPRPQRPRLTLCSPTPGWTPPPLGTKPHWRPFFSSATPNGFPHPCTSQPAMTSSAPSLYPKLVQSAQVPCRATWLPSRPGMSSATSLGWVVPACATFSMASQIWPLCFHPDRLVLQSPALRSFSSLGVWTCPPTSMPVALQPCAQLSGPNCTWGRSSLPGRNPF